MVAEIPLDQGVSPLGLISDGKDLWVTDHRGTIVYKIDPASNQVVARVDIGQDSCGAPAVAFGRLWLQPCEDGNKVVAIDVATNAVTGFLPAPFGVLVGYSSDAIWTTGVAGTRTQVERIDPVTLKPTMSAPASEKYDTYLVAGSTLWALDGGVPRIDQLDTSTGKLIGSVVVELPPDDSLYMVATDGGIWLKGYHTPDIVRVDLATHQVTNYSIPGYVHPSGYYDTPVIAALGSLWLRASDTSVTRLDPKTGSVTATFPADEGGGAVVVDFGSLWVANFGSGTVWRERLAP